jgi:hypothetical protein
MHIFGKQLFRIIIIIILNHKLQRITYDRKTIYSYVRMLVYFISAFLVFQGIFFISYFNDKFMKRIQAIFLFQ